MELNSIGYFQFDNLIQSRIPLVLVLLDEIDLKPWYNSVVRMHLENITVSCAAEKVLECIHEKKLPPHFAIVVLDNDGTRSATAAKSLEQAGFINAYYVKNGFSGLLSERQQ